MSAKCQICQTNEAEYAWQPDLGEVRETFYFLGSHQRGFMVVKVCDQCRQNIKAGKDVEFRYKGLDWWTQGEFLVNSSMSPYN